MRVGIVSDIHGNIQGLDAVLERMGAVDEVFCAGDAFDQYRFSNPVVARLRETGAHYILGNHEEVLLSPAGERAQRSSAVDPELLSWVRTRPQRIETVLDGKKLVMFHATPYPPHSEYVYPHSSELARFGELDADYAIYGHTHVALVRRINGTLIINPGSAGEGRDPANGRALSYAVLDTRSGEVELAEYPDPRRT